MAEPKEDPADSIVLHATLSFWAGRHCWPRWRRPSATGRGSGWRRSPPATSGRSPGTRSGWATELARQPDQSVPVEGLASGAAPLVDALLDAPLLGPPDINYILPMVRHSQAAAARVLADVAPDPVDVRSAGSRLAAWAVVQDAPDHVPFWWTHPLTIPQALLSLGVEPRLAVAVVGSQLIGFRASMGPAGSTRTPRSRRLPTWAPRSWPRPLRSTLPPTWSSTRWPP